MAKTNNCAIDVLVTSAILVGIGVVLAVNGIGIVSVSGLS
jgi:hypothetical protein